MSSFLGMNRSAFYIWSAYGFGVIAILVEILLLRSHRKAVLAQARSTPAAPAPDSVAVTE